MSEVPTGNRDDVSIVLAGEAGQGIQTVEHILTQLLNSSGYHVFATREFMSRIRGGINSTEIRVSSQHISSFVNKIDILIVLTDGVLRRLQERISPETVILGERDKLKDGKKENKENLIEIPFSDIASEVGGKIYINTVAVGLLSGILHIERTAVDKYLHTFFSRKGEDVVQSNIEAAHKGYTLAKDVLDPGKLQITIKRNKDVQHRLLLNGAEAVALGAIAGGCNFVSFYPMSPATTVGVFLAQHAQDFHIAAEQAEDEISAINMGIGAWYAGARALVSTSGGGFSLMAEGLSLAGMLESPMVVHIGQRPGPATGLPTRTEQGDLELVLRAGHGEFPRIIFAPGTIEQAFHLTQKAFNLADEYQTPVFVLTDQYLLDSTFQLSSLDLTEIQVKKHIVRTDKGYRRYKIVENGVSPRGIPGYGGGLVVVDSDEHDEEGHITEDFSMRTRMVNKRLRKLHEIKKKVVAPTLTGGKNYHTLLVTWGSTYAAAKEALTRLPEQDIALLHFSQVYPLHPSTATYLKRANEVVIIEGNATSQFGNLIQRETDCKVTHRILKYSGLPFSVEEIVQSVSQLADKEAHNG